MAECFVMEFKSNLSVKVITLPGFYTAFSVVFSTAVDISDDDGGIAMADILFKVYMTDFFFICSIKSPQCTDKYSKKVFSTAIFLPRVLM